MNNSDDFICNVLIVGKTGAGKSTLLNYLCDKKIADTGAGKPVTGEGIYEYPVIINNQEVRIFDSWGIEPGKTTRWNQLIKNELKKHGVQKNIEEWFHCIIYCIQAGGKIVDADAEIIHQILKEGYHLTIILTKADQVSEDVRTTMKNIIFKEFPEATATDKKNMLTVVATCAEQKKTISYKAEPFGKEDAIAAIFLGWKETIVDRMPKHVIGQTCELIDEWAKEKKHIIQDEGFPISGIKADNKLIYQVLAESAKESINTIQQELLPIILKESIDSCRKASASLRNTFDVPINASFFDEFLKNAENSILSFIKNFFKGFFIIPAIAEFITVRSKKHIIAQKNEICGFIEELASIMKQEVGKAENQISEIIEDALS